MAKQTAVNRTRKLLVQEEKSRRPGAELRAHGLEPSSFESLVSSFVRKVVGDDRNGEIVHRHFTMTGQNQATYASRGKEAGVSRQRIHQIVLRGRRALLARAQMLGELWQEIRRQLAQSGGLIRVEDLSRGLAEHFCWRRRPDLHTLRNVLSLAPAFALDEHGEYMYGAGFLCISCSRAVARLKQVIDAADRLTLAEAGEKLAHLCRKGCPEDCLPPAAFSAVFVRYAAQGHRSMMVVDCDELLSRKAWLTKKGLNLRDVALETLRKLGKPVHHYELTRLIAERYPGFADLTPKRLRACLGKHKVFRTVARGVYALSAWNQKKYVVRSKAIAALIKHKNRPMSGKEIVSTLTKNGLYSASNIRQALEEHPRIIRLGNDLFDVPDRVR